MSRLGGMMSIVGCWGEIFDRLFHITLLATNKEHQKQDGE